MTVKELKERLDGCGGDDVQVKVVATRRSDGREQWYSITEDQVDFSRDHSTEDDDDCLRIDVTFIKLF